MYRLIIGLQGRNYLNSPKGTYNWENFNLPSIDNVGLAIRTSQVGAAILAFTLQILTTEALDVLVTSVTWQMNDQVSLQLNNSKGLTSVELLVTFKSLLGAWFEDDTFFVEIRFTAKVHVV